MILNKSTSIVLIAFSLLANFSSAQTHDEIPIALSGFSVSEAFEIADDKPLEITAEPFRRTLYRVKQTSNANLNLYAAYSAEVPWKKIVDATPDYRLWVFQRRGRVKSVTPIRWPNADRDTPIKGVFLNACETEEGEPFVVVTLGSPMAWKEATTLDEPIEFTGFLYSLYNPGPNPGPPLTLDPTPTPLFIAKRLAWHPTHPDPALNVTPARVQLATHGVDIGRFDLLRTEHNKPLGIADAELFYQFLNAVQSISSEPKTSPVAIESILRQPLKEVGSAVSFRASVKQCSRVERPQPKLENNFALGTKNQPEFDHYYQLIVFPDLDLQVELPNPDPEKPPLVYRRFPFTVCVRELPPGITPTELENQSVWIDGFFYRFWRYGSERTDAAGLAGQPSPIVMARQPVLLASDSSQLKTMLAILLSGLVIGSLSLLWFFRSDRAPRQFSDDVLPDRIDISGIEE